MLTASYLHHLNIGAASLHALQAIIVICIIGASHNSEKGPLLSGVYALKKNVYVSVSYTHLTLPTNREV